MSLQLIVVEDSHEKADQICSVANKTGVVSSICICSTITEAMESISSHNFDLMILDISMDISQGGNQIVADNHDMLGGLAFARELFLNEMELPTIVVTAHESFLDKVGPKAKISSLMSIAELSDQFAKLFGNLFLGVVRYQKESWSALLEESIKKAAEK